MPTKLQVKVSGNGGLWVDADELMKQGHVREYVEKVSKWKFGSNIADQYQEFTRTTTVFDDAVEYEYLHFGLVAEIGELFGKIAKARRDTDDHQVDDEQIKGELGDICWFVARLCDYYGFSFSSVLLANRDKLIDRQNRDVIKGNGDDR